MLSKDLTQGNIRIGLIQYAFPLVLANMCQTVYTTIDTYIVGKYLGTVGIAAISVCYPIYCLITYGITGLSAGVSILMGQYYGQHNKEKVISIANCAIVLFTVISLVISVGGFFLTPWMLKAMNVPQETFSMATVYMRTICCGSWFISLYNLICGYQRGLGDAKTTLIFMVASSILNVFLDVVMIGVLKQGVFGASLATIIAQAIIFGCGIFYFRKKKHFMQFRLKEMEFHKQDIKELIKICFPLAGEQICLYGGELIGNSIVNGFGLAASAGYGLALKIDMIFFMALEGLSQSVAAYVSQNKGIGDMNRIRMGMKEALRIGLVVALISMFLLNILNRPIAKLFNSDMETIDYATRYMSTMSFVFPIWSVYNVTNSYVKGIGRSILLFAASVFSCYAIRIPFSYYVASRYGFNAMPFAIFLMAIGCLFFYLIYYFFYLINNQRRSVS